MNISLIDVDGRNFPNFALAKISAYHKQKGDTVDWYSPMFSNPDCIYASKVFTFSEDYAYFPDDIEVIKGGTGYDIYSKLPDEIENCLPDLSLYSQYDFAYGFLSRGCIRKCPWCVVPRKEGNIRRYDDIERISQGKRHIILMDNNFLANDSEFVKDQLQKAIKNKFYLDFNQALDARLVNEENAYYLAKCKWRNPKCSGSYIRFSCDYLGVIEPCKKAIQQIRKAGYKGEFFIYCLAKEVDDTLERINELCAFDKKIMPFVMPYRNLDGDGKIANPELKRLANWCNKASVRNSCKWEHFK